MLLNTFLPYRVARLAQQMTASISQVYADRFGLTRDEWRVLAATGEAKSQPTRLVAEQTGLDKVAISRAASSLEDRGLIRRNEDRHDRRIKILGLTEAGREMLAELERVVKARESYLLEGLDERERAAFDDMIDKLHARAEALSDPEVAQRCRPDCEGGCGKASEMLDFAGPIEGDATVASRRMRVSA